MQINSKLIKNKLLWINPNPTNEFNAQSITLLDDIEKYESIEILFDDFAPYKNYSFSKCLSNIPYGIIHCFSFNDGNGIITRNRYLGPITSGKTLPFANGYQNGNIDNSKCVPLKIYGIEKL